MSGEYERIPEVALSYIEILVDQNLRKDGIVKPLKEWPDAHILHLSEILEIELKSRSLG